MTEIKFRQTSVRNDYIGSVMTAAKQLKDRSRIFDFEKEPRTAVWGGGSLRNNPLPAEWRMNNVVEEVSCSSEDSRIKHRVL